MQSRFSTPLIFAHRGASLIAPENTMAAFTLARQAGARWVELDVQLTQDHEVVVIHDTRLQRTTNGTGSVSSNPLSSLKTLDAGSWFDARFQGESIPTLEQCLQLFVKKSIAVNIEIKGRSASAILVQKTLDLVRTYSSQLIEPPLLSSSYYGHLHRLRQWAPDLSYGVIMNYWPYYFGDVVRDSRCCSLHLNQGCLTPKRLSILKKLNKTVFVYTVNELEHAKALLDMGVNGLFTDNLSLLSLLESARAA